MGAMWRQNSQVTVGETLEHSKSPYPWALGQMGASLVVKI